MIGLGLSFVFVSAGMISHVVPGSFVELLLCIGASLAGGIWAMSATNVRICGAVESKSGLR